MITAPLMEEETIMTDYQMKAIFYLVSLLSDAFGSDSEKFREAMQHLQTLTDKKPNE
jgi:hypothetical protein